MEEKTEPASKVSEGANGEKLDPWRSVTRAAFLGGSALYGIGLVIVNVDLSQYGIFNPGLARVEYVMAGLLWFFLSISAIAYIDGIATYAKRTYTSDRPIGSALSVLGTAFSYLIVFYWVVNIVSRNGVSVLEPRSLPAILAIMGSAAAVRSVAQNIKRVFSEGSFHFGSLLAGRTMGRIPLYSIALAMTMLTLYGRLAFPLFPKEFGGGQRLVVCLYSESTWPSARFALGLPVSDSNQIIGPVELLLETDAHIMVTGPYSVFAPWYKELLPWWRSGDTVAFDKKATSAVLYKSAPARRGAKCPEESQKRNSGDNQTIRFLK